ncbi:MAG: sigma-70 family RNA polymerase sigma factor [Planctomycetaceae bacterium]
MMVTMEKRRTARLSDAARNDLVLEHLGYVRHILSKLVLQLPYGIDTENLESAGVLGLIEASGHFDPARNVEFKTFAYQRIRGAILDELRRNCPLSQQMLQKIAFLRDCREQLHEPITIEELADEARMSDEEVSECMQASRLARPESWDDSLGEHSAVNPDESQWSVEQDEMKQVLTDGIELLPDTMRIAVTLHYSENLKLREVGEVLGLSESRVSRIVNAARERLRDYAKSRGY